MEAINVYDDKMVKKKEEVIEETPDIEISETDVEPELDLSVSQLDGVGAVTQKKLEAFGVTNIIDICVRGSREVSEITSVSKATCDTWVFKGQNRLEDNVLIRKADMGVTELLDNHDNLTTLCTKCEEFDNLMGGGVKPEATYEIYGEFGAGKTV